LSKANVEISAVAPPKPPQRPISQRGD